MSNSVTKNSSRRDFLRGLAAGGAVGALGMMGVYSYGPWAKRHFPQVASKNIDIGLCRSARIVNISETSWFNNAELMGDIKGAGGLLVNQYTYNWPPFSEPKGQLAKGSYEQGMRYIKKYLPDQLERAWEFQLENAVHPLNTGGYACLVDIELLDGSKKRILMDTGWSYAWMDECFKREGIDKMLANKEIDFLVLTHEHFDHFWGLPVTLKYYPDIPIYVPKGFYAEGLQYIKDSGHRGKLTILENGLNQILPGVATYVFPIPIICRVYGEQSMYVNIKDLGLVSVTGCCHQGILQFAQTARETIKFDKFHGIYGGLHISPFEDWDPKNDDLVIAFRDWGFTKVGCNHCTGIITAKKLVEAGYGVVKGTARFRSKDIAYLGNGDTIQFGPA